MSAFCPVCPHPNHDRYICEVVKDGHICGCSYDPRTSEPVVAPLGRPAMIYPAAQSTEAADLFDGTAQPTIPTTIPADVRSVADVLLKRLSDVIRDAAAIRKEFHKLNRKVGDGLDGLAKTLDEMTRQAVASVRSVARSECEDVVRPLLDRIAALEKTVSNLPNFSPYRSWEPRDAIDWGQFLSEEDLLEVDVGAYGGKLVPLHGFPKPRVIDRPDPKPVEETDPS